MTFLIVLSWCFLSVFQGSQSRGINPVTDEVLEVFAALRRGSVHSVENALSSVSVNSEDDHAYTLLMRAAERGDERMVEMLIKHEADANKSDWLNKFTPLHSANKDRGCDMRWDCKPKDKVNYDRVTEILIKNGADVSLPDAYGNTVLHDAAQYGFEKVAELILNSGNRTVVNHKRSDGRTPLCFVAFNGAYTESHNKIADLLIKHGAEVNVLCNAESTPLHLAAYKRSEIQKPFGNVTSNDFSSTVN